MAGEMQEHQVGEPVVFVVAVFMVDFNVTFHRKEEVAISASSALVLEEFSMDCVQSHVFSSPCAPVAPVAIIRTYPFL